MLIVCGQVSEVMDVISAPDEFAKHDSLIMSMKNNNFQRLAGELNNANTYVCLHVCMWQLYFFVEPRDVVP